MRSSMKKAAALALSACLLMGSAQAVKASDFSDLKSNHWAYSYIDKAAQAGLVSGMGEGKFGPESKLSNAQFITMVCNLLYEDKVNSFPSGAGSSWWLPYLNAAQSVGILDNTTIAAERSAAGAWNATMANAEINRYDMAQIMMNVAKEEGWTAATSSQISAAQSQIADWSSIPSKYQNAVASAYAKKYLSGMDDKGTFLGTATMNRAQGAVVLCKLADESEAEQTPTYTNTTNLVNGKIPNATNVASALNALRMEYPQNDKWNMNRAYESVQMGTSIGSEAFANTLSDRVFGNLKAQKHTNAAALKVGDVVYMSKTGLYGVVTDVDDEMFDYVGCSETGNVTWRGTGWLSDLGSKDTITTRYGSTTNENALANGQSPTESNVSRALWNLNGSYYDGSLWSVNEKYTSKVMGTGYGSRGLAYFFSDEVFGSLKMVEHYRPNDLRVGDVFRMGNQNDDNAYGIVVDVNKTQGTFQYANVYNNTIEWDNNARITDLNGYPIYSRYPNTTPSTNTGNTNGKLTNGTDATDANVRNLVSSLQSQYPANTYDWSRHNAFSTSNGQLQYRSSVLGTGYNSQALAYYLSDQIFGTLPRSQYTNNGQYNLRVGDVVVFGNNNAGLVTSVTNNNSFTYTTLYTSLSGWSTATAGWSQSGNLSYYSSGSVTIYTRYPSSNTNSGSYNNAASGTLVNGAQPTESNASSLLNSKAAVGSYWGNNTSYRSNILGQSANTNQAFVYRASDEVFGNLPATTYNYNNLYSYTPRIGDIVRFNNNGFSNGEYGILTSSGNSVNGTFNYLALNSAGYAATNTGLYSEVSFIQTRYPTSTTSNTTLANNQPATESNVTYLLNTLMSQFPTGYSWNTNPVAFTYVSSAFSSGGQSSSMRSFAHYISDQVFGYGKNTARQNNVSNIKAGDLIETTSMSLIPTYQIVTSVNRTNNTYTYVMVDSVSGQVTWQSYPMSIALLNSTATTVWTRY